MRGEGTAVIWNPSVLVRPYQHISGKFAIWSHFLLPRPYRWYAYNIVNVTGGQTEKRVSATDQKVQDFIESLEPTRKPKVVFDKNYVRNGTIFNHGEAGLLLDDVAIDILVKKMLDMIATLSIKQGKGYMFVDTVEVDYNDSDKSMRVKHDPSSINHNLTGEYAHYYTAKQCNKE